MKTVLESNGSWGKINSGSARGAGKNLTHSVCHPAWLPFAFSFLSNDVQRFPIKQAFVEEKAMTNPEKYAD